MLRLFFYTFYKARIPSRLKPPRSRGHLEDIEIADTDSMAELESICRLRGKKATSSGFLVLIIFELRTNPKVLAARPISLVMEGLNLASKALGFSALSPNSGTV